VKKDLARGQVRERKGSRMKKGVVVALALGILLALAAPAVAQESTCPALSTGHLDADDQTSFTVTAPAGSLISQVCVKAGSDQQGNGPEIINYDPPVASATFSHTSGKEISHYSVLFVPVPTPSESPPTTPPGGGGGGGGGGAAVGAAGAGGGGAPAVAVPGQLAVTGPREAIPWLAGLAVLLALSGVSLLALAKRRS
jgi:hypothetical protein